MAEHPHMSGVRAELVGILNFPEGKADGSTLPSFQKKAWRLRERSYPERIPAKTRRSFESRYLRVTHGRDGMPWLSL